MFSKNATPYAHISSTPQQPTFPPGRTDSLGEILSKPPGNSQLNLPMTDYYLQKHGGTHLPKFNRPISASNFNHAQNNAFSQALERDRIVSEERLKQRFDEGYLSKYQGGP